MTTQPNPLKFPESDSFWMPTQSSVTAHDIDWLYDVMVWISVLSAVGIFAAMFYFCLKYKAKSRAANEKVEKTADHNTTLEITWSFIPLVISIALFVWGFKGYVDLRTPPKDSMEIHVSGQKWKWIFDYQTPLGSFPSDELHVPVNTNVRVIISSVDVLHSLFIPDFRVKMDAVPGRYTDLWFNATRTGEFPIECAEYCGTAHSDMLTKTVVHTTEGYQAWIQEQILKLETMPPIELGKMMYDKQGCATCHSTDGTPRIGPTWKGIFGSSEKLADGSTVKVDENYIRESIVDPQLKLVAGYPPSMPTYQGKLSDKMITGIIEYIKSLK
jgi:cytochrome c oxidase subunit 2